MSETDVRGSTGMPPNLCWRTGSATDIPVLLAEHVLKAGPPALSWLEPRPALGSGGVRGRLPGYRMLYRGQPDLTLPVRELRLFWPDHALHLVQHAQGACWVEISDRDMTGKSGWQAMTGVRRLGYDVWLRKDLKLRFSGLDPVKQTHKVGMIEYWQGGSLFAWRIVPT